MRQRTSTARCLEAQARTALGGHFYPSRGRTDTRRELALMPWLAGLSRLTHHPVGEPILDAVAREAEPIDDLDLPICAERPPTTLPAVRL
jgi:hypothetical protein